MAAVGAIGQTGVSGKTAPPGPTGQRGAAHLGAHPWAGAGAGVMAAVAVAGAEAAGAVAGGARAAAAPPGLRPRRMCLLLLHRSEEATGQEFRQGGQEGGGGRLRQAMPHNNVGSFIIQQEPAGVDTEAGTAGWLALE